MKTPVQVTVGWLLTRAVKVERFGSAKTAIENERVFERIYYLFKRPKFFNDLWRRCGVKDHVPQWRARGRYRKCVYGWSRRHEKPQTSTSSGGILLTHFVSGRNSMDYSRIRIGLIRAVCLESGRARFRENRVRNRPLWLWTVRCNPPA